MIIATSGLLNLIRSRVQKIIYRDIIFRRARTHKPLLEGLAWPIRDRALNAPGEADGG
jgi:hypothetical protein